MLSPIISTNINQIASVCKQHHVKELYVFGSAARNEMNAESDVDFLYTMYEFPVEESADNFFDLAEKLETLLGRKVDLVPEKHLINKYFIRELNETRTKIFNG